MLFELPWRNGQILATVVAGISISNLSSLFNLRFSHDEMPNLTYFRIIPNTAAAIGQSMTLVSSLAANPKEQQLMLDLLAPLGPTMLVPEDQLNAATALASCGTAYVMKYIQAATQAGIELGLSASDARWLTTQCVLGAAALLQDNPDAHPAKGMHTGRIHHTGHQRAGARRVHQCDNPGHQSKRMIFNG